MNSRFRCAGCRKYKPQPGRKVGSVKVCSDACRTTYLNQARLPLKKPDVRRTTKLHRDDPSRETRNKVLERDNYTCRFCGRVTADHVHHINYRSQGVDHSEMNLISLCVEHHDLVHANKKLWQPLLRAVIWNVYVKRRSVTVLQVQRQLQRSVRL